MGSRRDSHSRDEHAAEQRRLSRAGSVDIQGYASSRRPADVLRTKRVLVSDAAFRPAMRKIHDLEKNRGFAIIQCRCEMNLREVVAVDVERVYTSNFIII